jgi:hypothetical protein
LVLAGGPGSVTVKTGDAEVRLVSVIQLVLPRLPVYWSV